MITRIAKVDLKGSGLYQAPRSFQGVHPLVWTRRPSCGGCALLSACIWGLHGFLFTSAPAGSVVSRLPFSWDLLSVKVIFVVSAARSLQGWDLKGREMAVQCSWWGGNLWPAGWGSWGWERVINLWSGWGEWALQELGCVTWLLLQYVIASASDFGGETARFASHSLRLASNTLQTLLPSSLPKQMSLYVLLFPIWASKLIWIACSSFLIWRLNPLYESSISSVYSIFFQAGLITAWNIPITSNGSRFFTVEDSTFTQSVSTWLQPCCIISLGSYDFEGFIFNLFQHSSHRDVCSD